MSLFFVSLGCIIGLFSLKYWEYRAGRRIAPRVRQRADEQALSLKNGLARSRIHLEKLPPEIAHLALRAVASLALLAAFAGRSLEREAYRLADFVSAKRGFKRRETKSEFLKQVTEYKSGPVEDSEDL